MNNKFMKVIAIIFVVLFALVSLPWLKEKISGQKNPDTSNLSVNLSGFSKEKTEKVVIKKGNDEKILNRKNDGWYIGEDKADEEKIDQMFKDFSDLKIKELVSQNEDNHKKFEVTKDDGIQLTISQNGKDSVFFAGKAGMAIEDFYLRKEGIKNVYLVNGGLREKLTWDAGKWKAEEKK